MMFEAIAFNFKRKKRLSHMRQPLDFLEPLIGFEPTTLSLRTAVDICTAYIVFINEWETLYFVFIGYLFYILHLSPSIIAP